jgi:hypothetical protein
MGFALLFMRRHEESGIHYATAVDLSPADFRTHTGYAAWLAFVGRNGEALDYLEASLIHNPFVSEWYWEVCRFR